MNIKYKNKLRLKRKKKERNTEDKVKDRGSGEEGLEQQKKYTNINP
jgi:hypothetical protein